MGLAMHWHGVPLHVQLEPDQIVGFGVYVIPKACND